MLAGLRGADWHQEYIAESWSQQLVLEPWWDDGVGLLNPPLSRETLGSIL